MSASFRPLLVGLLCVGWVLLGGPSLTRAATLEAAAQGDTLDLPAADGRTPPAAPLGVTEAAEEPGEEAPLGGEDGVATACASARALRAPVRLLSPTATSRRRAPSCVLLGASPRGPPAAG